MKYMYHDFSSDENLVYMYSEHMIFMLHTVKISLPDFLNKLFAHFKWQWCNKINKILYIAITFRIQINATYFF